MQNIFAGVAYRLQLLGESIDQGAKQRVFLGRFLWPV